jgi:3-mercaptopyruvate sulfurtransferase SseA
LHRTHAQCFPSRDNRYNKRANGRTGGATAFTLETMGGDKVSNDYRSWGEWGNDPDSPVVKPKN